MTIDETIIYCEEVAKHNEEQARIYEEQGETMASYSCKECASEHRQRAEWLRELKDLREKLEPQPCEECKFANNNSFCEVCCHYYSSMFADRLGVKANE